jgi:hypothetical protein
MSLEVRPVARPEELAAVPRHRYRRYVEVLDHPQLHADPVERAVERWRLSVHDPRSPRSRCRFRVAG